MPAIDVSRERVLVVGDLNPDLVLQGDVVPRFGQAEQLLDAARLVIGGSAGITAHGCARLGRPVSLAAAIGADLFGTTMTTALAEAGVDTSALVVHRDLPTGLSVVLSTGPDRAVLTMPGAIPALTAADVRAAVERFLPAGLRHVHVCSYFLQPALATELAAVLAEIKAAGVTTSLDTNDDPAGRWLGVADLLPFLDLLLPNRREALALAGGNDAGATDPGVPDLSDACRSLATRGPLVVVKDGADGACAVNADGVIAREPGHPIDPVDVSGAGDSFNAAFIDSWLRGLSVTECLADGVNAGARSVSAVGGTAGQPTFDQLLNDRRTA